MSANLQHHLKGSLHKRLPFVIRLIAQLLICFALAALAILPATAQTPAKPAPKKAAPASFSQWRNTKDALIRDVLASFQKGDIATVAALTLNSNEYKELVWPQLPISNPRNNTPFEFVFGRHNQMSRGGVVATMHDLKGKSYEVVSFKVLPEKDKYSSIHIYPIGNVTLKDSQGKTVDMRIVGSILESEGKFKVFSYLVD